MGHFKSLRKKMKKSLTLVLIFYVLLVSAPIVFAVDAAGGVDALCEGQVKIVAITNIIRYVLPGAVAVVCIVSGAMLVRKEHMGSGLTIIVVGVVVGIILTAILFPLHNQLDTAMREMCGK
jgi:mannose/fructose/N-acetylgalactosamine-specific phosphotransferase system component IID